MIGNVRHVLLASQDATLKMLLRCSGLQFLGGYLELSHAAGTPPRTCHVNADVASSLT